MPPRRRPNFPRSHVARTLGQLRRQRSRMKFDPARRLGLPISVRRIESIVKQINNRMQGAEKFRHQGAEPLFVSRADHLNEADLFDLTW